MPSKRDQEVIRKHYQRIGKKGGRNRALKLTPEERKAIAQLANRARQKKALDRQEREDDTVGKEE